MPDPGFRHDFVLQGLLNQLGVVLHQLRELALRQAPTIEILPLFAQAEATRLDCSIEGVALGEMIHHLMVHAGDPAPN